ncbi:trypsin-like peptidase domain-containing protein [Pseudoxanthomonas sp.]|uniref:trypsin-like serine peptidase n=1 Tax=Pseudoxanthomonas sp. TaxID=1871049 RepID=UPI002FDFF409
MNPPTLIRILATFALLTPCVASAGVTQAAGEASRTPVQAAPAWKLAQFPARSATQQAYREVPLRRLVDLENRNTRQRIKATQIGIGRTLASEGIARTTPALRWVPLKTGGAVARLQVDSPDALGLRVGVQVKGLHPQVELRVAGSDDPGRVIASVTAAEAQALADGNGLYWTPATDGIAQIIEIYRPAHVNALQARLQAPQVSHLLTNSRNDFKILKALGDSGACNINAVCRVDALGPAYVQAKNAVAHMVFTKNGSSYVCTGTLLNDTTPSTQVPYFYSAAHCIDNQTVANTLNTYWGYENSGCSTVDGRRTNPLTGGAELLFVDADSDALLLRLRNPAPAIATFAGWDASPLAANAEVIAIHHPAGDAKKYSRGQHVIDRYPQQFTVGWLEGTTEGGSSGSGLFTRYRDNSYRLRGGLYGGDALCSNSGSLANTENRDHYSRLDLVFPQIRQWIAADPVRENSAQPLVRSAGAVAQGQGARMSPATSTPAPAAVTPPSGRERQPQATPRRAGMLER